MSDRLTIDCAQRIQQITAHYDEGGSFGEIGGTHAIIGELLLYLNAAHKREENLTSKLKMAYHLLPDDRTRHMLEAKDMILKVLKSSE